jgi:hypothetical protein
MQIKLLAILAFLLFVNNAYSLFVIIRGGEELWFYLGWEDWVGTIVLMIIYLVVSFGVWAEKVWSKYIVYFLSGLFAVLVGWATFVALMENASLGRLYAAKVIAISASVLIVAVWASLTASRIGGKGNG